MENDVTKIHDHPTVTREALLFPLLLMLYADIFNNGFCESIDHAVAGAGTNNEIIGKGYDIFQVNKDDVFSLFIFKGVYDFTSKFQCVQISPQLCFFNGAENSFVYIEPLECSSLLYKWMESTLAEPILPS